MVSGNNNILNQLLGGVNPVSKTGDKVDPTIGADTESIKFDQVLAMFTDKTNLLVLPQENNVGSMQLAGQNLVDGESPGLLTEEQMSLVNSDFDLDNILEKNLAEFKALNNESILNEAQINLTVISANSNMGK